MKKLFPLLALGFLVLLPSTGLGVMESPVLKKVGLDEKIGALMPLDVSLTRHDGEKVDSRDWLTSGKPVVLTLNYFRCKTICDKMLFDLAKTIKKSRWAPGEGYKVVTISIDPHETAADAAKKRAQVLAIADEQDADWDFLVGSEEDVRKIADTVGYRYTYDEKTNQWGHPAVFMLLSSGGNVMGYRQGLSITPRDLEFSLVEAGEGAIGSLGDQLVVSCYIYDDAEGEYVPFAWGVMRAGGALTVLFLGMFLYRMIRADLAKTQRENA